MTRLFRSKSCGLVGLTERNYSVPPSPFFHHGKENADESVDDASFSSTNPISTPNSRYGCEGQNGNSSSSHHHNNNNHHQILDILVTALRKSLVTCSVDTEDISSMDISWPTEVRHVSHVTFDRFNGFLGLPTDLEPDLPTKVPSASVTVFGVSANSMQCSYDHRGNSVPTILLMMQNRLYAEGGLQAEGIFRINAENGQEEYVRDQLNKGVVPHGIDVHCLAGLIKAWLRELPNGVLDSLTPDQVMHCNTEQDCTQLVNLLPPTEAALLHWAINLMADVVQHESHNKMNARNIAMVFAPNMTQMADPLTALIHAVQVMNLLKTLILKTIREREELADNPRLLSSCSDSSNIQKDTSFDLPLDSNCNPERPATSKFSRPATLGTFESETKEIFWSFDKCSDGEEEFESVSGSNTPPDPKRDSENGFRGGGGYDNGDWLSLRKGVRRLCRHPVFHLGKPATKKSQNLGIVNTREGGGETWA